MRVQRMNYGFAALAAGLLAFGIGSGAYAEPMKLRMGWAVVPGQIAPILMDSGVAKHAGKSYTLEMTRYASSATTLQALGAGELDLAPITFTQLGPAIQNAGLTDLRIVADEFRDGAEGYESGLYVVLKDGPIQKVEDLKGKVVAINGVGGGQDIFMRVMLRKHGLETPRDYTIIEGTFPVMRAMLAEKKADMVISVKPFSMDPAFQAIARTLFTQKEAVGPSDMIFLTTRTGIIEKNRAAMVDFFEDFIRGTRWYMDPANHDKVVEVVSRFTKIPPQQIGWISTKGDYYRDPNAAPDVESLQRSVGMLKDFGFLKNEIDVNQYTDLSIVQEAAQRLK